MMTMHWAMTDADILRIWNMFGHKDSIWKRLEAPTIEDFTKVIHESVVVLELDFGYIRVEQMLKGYFALVHGAFWNTDVVRHRDGLLKAAKILQDEFDLICIDVPIPVGIRSLHKLVQSLGFQFLKPCMQTGPASTVPGEIWRLWV